MSKKARFVTVLLVCSSAALCACSGSSRTSCDQGYEEVKEGSFDPSKLP